MPKVVVWLAEKLGESLRVFGMSVDNLVVSHEVVCSAPNGGLLAGVGLTTSFLLFLGVCAVSSLVTADRLNLVAVDTERLANELRSILTWRDLTDAERDRVTRALNCLELAGCRLSSRSECVPVVGELL